MRGVALLIAVSCVLAGCGGSARNDTWAGLGARLADWEDTHPRGTGSGLEGCTSEGCYGSRLKLGSRMTYEFTSVEKTRVQQRVYGYEQSFAPGTSLATARTRVLELLPPDVKTKGFRVFHTVERSFDPA
jgi:hypothetical protein